MMQAYDLQRFNQAVAMAQAGQQEQAHAILSQLIQIYPEEVNALFWFAFTSSSLAEARSVIARAERLQPNNPTLAHAKSWLAQMEAQASAASGYSYQHNPESGQDSYTRYTSQNSTGYTATGAPRQNGNYSTNQGYQSQPQQRFAYNTQNIGFFGRFGLGWAFMKQAFSMVGKDRNLIKPSFYSLGANLLVSLVLAVPLYLMYVNFRHNGVVLYGALFLLAVVNYFITYFFSSMTIHLVYQHLKTGQSSPQAAWQASKRKAFTILAVATISAFISTLRRFLRENNRGLARLVTGFLMGLIDAIWTTYTYFILPLIITEDLGVGPAVKRATYIIKNNLLQVGVGFVGLGLVCGLLSFAVVIIVVGITVSIFLALATVSPLMAFILAVGVFIIALAGLSAFTSYLRIAYYTCLVAWAQDVERFGNYAPAPQPLHLTLKDRAYTV
ncbi:MAG TPA: DUF6159 family protein [Chloroflexia bacterium]|nr:DUF6159 family protein [Chloroflexia bacterium]